MVPSWFIDWILKTTQKDPKETHNKIKRVFIQNLIQKKLKRKLINTHFKSHQKKNKRTIDWILKYLSMSEYSVSPEYFMSQD